MNSTLPQPPSRHPINEQAQKFGAGMQQELRQSWETGNVLDYDPEGQTYVVKTATGRTMSSVARIITVAGEVSIIPRGTVVVMHYELGFPAICGILKGQSMAVGNKETAPNHFTEVPGVGGDDPVYASSRPGTGRAENEPLDVISDDWHRMSKDGNSIGVMAGGVNQMRSSGMSQVRTHLLDELVEILSNRFKHITAMGDLNITNDDGKTSLIWRAGADQSTENGANRANWTVRLDVGSEGDLFKFEVTTPGGQSLAQIKLTSEGRVEIFGVSGVDVTAGDRGPSDEVVGGSKTVEILEDRTESVGGTETLSSGSRKVSTSNNDELTVGGTRKTMIVGDDMGVVNGSQKLRMYQDVIHDILQGNKSTVIANPSLGGLIVPPTDYQVVNYGGSIHFALPNVAGTFAVVSDLPGSVMLGASGTPVYNPLTGLHQIAPVAPYGAVLFEPLANLISQLLIWLDTHTHLTGVGPTGPAAAGTSGPITPQLTPSIPGIRSLRVLLGA